MEFSSSTAGALAAISNHILVFFRIEIYLGFAVRQAQALSGKPKGTLGFGIY
jgi:hypothetical protein